MADIQISCIVKRGGNHNPHERIQRLGGYHNSAAWSHSEDEVINFIVNRVHTFFVQEGGRRANVITATHNGRVYLKTVADGYSPDNLLSLRPC